MLNTNGKWSNEFPTREDDGRWFFVKVENGAYTSIRIVEVRCDEHGIYLAGECNDRGIVQRSYGTRLDMYNKNCTQFCGAINMPPNYRANLT